MADDAKRLFDLMDTLGQIARMMHPRRLDALVDLLGDRDTGFEMPGPLAPAADLAVQACAGLRGSIDADNPFIEALRALRSYSRALEVLASLADVMPEVGRYLLEPADRDNPTHASPALPDTGAFHFNNESTQRGGYSVFVPPWYDANGAAPLLMALHGGSGHGRLFLWNWLPESRSRGMIIVAPTAIGRTWSLMDPEIDSRNLEAILTTVRARWHIDSNHMMLSGMSDGGTFTLLAGLNKDSSFTHLAPVAASFHPLMLAIAEPARLAKVPIHLTHGEQDWMFPVEMARTAQRTLSTAGAAITYREIADLSHAYPRDGQGEVLDWFLRY